MSISKPRSGTLVVKDDEKTAHGTMAGGIAMVELQKKNDRESVEGVAHGGSFG